MGCSVSIAPRQMPWTVYAQNAVPPPPSTQSRTINFGPPKPARAVEAKGFNQVAVKVLRTLGYRVAVKPVVGDRFWGAVGDSRNRVQIAFTGLNPGYPDPAVFLAQSFSCAAFLPGNPLNLNPSGFCDPGIDRQMRRAQAEQLRDPIGSRARWARVDREVTDAAPWVPLMFSKNVNFLSKRVGNYQYNPQQFVLVDQLWVR
jgi:peptide/nickel transport system substrate-binding protein